MVQSTVIETSIAEGGAQFERIWGRVLLNNAKDSSPCQTKRAISHSSRRKSCAEHAGGLRAHRQSPQRARRLSENAARDQYLATGEHGGSALPAAADRIQRARSRKLRLRSRVAGGEHRDGLRGQASFAGSKPVFLTGVGGAAAAARVLDRLPVLVRDRPE